MSNLSKELIRQIIADGGFQTPKDIGDYLKDMFKDVIQEMLEKELALELGYEKGDSLNKILKIEEMDIVKKLLNHNLEI